MTAASASNNGMPSTGRKLRPKLRPKSPSETHASDDEGLGFEDILTGASAATAKDDEVAMGNEKPTLSVMSVPPPQSTLSSSASVVLSPSDADDRMKKDGNKCQKGNDNDVDGDDSQPITAIVDEKITAALDCTTQYADADEDNNNKTTDRRKEMDEDGTTSIIPERSSSEVSSSSQNGNEAESSSDSSSSTDSDSESDSESEASDNIKDEDAASSETTHLQQLQGEIRTRQKLMAKLLRGKEGTTYANMIQAEEKLVNSHLLGRAENDSTILSPKPNSTHSNPIRTIKTMLLDEYYHTLPGAFSLVLHCVLYVTIYALVSKAMNWLCDVTIIYFTNWDVNNNYFDCTAHEFIFYSIVLVLSLLVSRITGVVYDWNDKRAFHKRLEFIMRNKWHLKCWDAKLMNYFNGDTLNEEFDNNEAGCDDEEQKEEPTHQRRKRWGPWVKYILDLFSFFICYKCVDFFVFSIGVAPFSDITQTVLDGMPSRQLQKAPVQHTAEAGVSYACPNVMSALDNPYALDMLKWIAASEFESDEVNNWITNAKKCGWQGSAVGGGVDNYDCTANEEDEINECTVEENDDIDTESDSDESNHPTFLMQKRIMSTHDDNYLQNTVSHEAYYDLVGDPNPRFFDPVREMIFLVLSTAICFGLLYAFGIPFLLI